MAKTKNYEIDMTNGPIMPKLVTFIVPLMISSMLQLMFNAVDLVVVGRFSGNEALAAVGSTSALINMFTNLFIGTSLGTNVMAARYRAMGRADKLQDTVHTSIWWSVLSGIFMVFVGLVGSTASLKLMGTPADVLSQADLYMKIYFAGMPFFMVYNYGAAILRAVGDTRRPLYYLVIAGAINAALNMFLVIVFHLGVVGVAVATVVSQMVSCYLVVRCLMRTTEDYKLNLKALKIHKGILMEILRVGIPCGLQGTVINFSNVLLQSSVNSFGSIAMAGYTAANNVLGFIYMTANSITQACLSFTSQNLGAKKPERMDRVLIDCLILETFLTGAVGVTAYLCGPTLLSFYTSSEEVLVSGMQILSVTSWLYFLCGYMDCIPGAMRGMGHSGVPMVLSIIGTVGLRVVWVFLLFPRFRSLDFLFISYPASWILTIILQLSCFIFVRRNVRKSLQLGEM